MSDQVDWNFARTVAGKVGGREPFAESYLREAFEQDMLELTPKAEGLVEIETGLVSAVGPARARITDRLGWVDANLASFDRLLRPLLGRMDNDDVDEEADAAETRRFTDRLADRLGLVGDTIRPYGNVVEDSVVSAASTTTAYVGPKMAGAEVGALLGWMSGRVLGQYDLLLIEDERPDDQDWVYYVAPNMMSLEKRYGFPPREFRLWVAVHECTHRAQFTGVPWLQPYFLSLVNELLDNVDPDPKRFFDTIRETVEARRSGEVSKVAEGGLGALLASPAQKETMNKVSGLMSLLEGHGDITMDRAAKDLIPNQARFSRVMSQRRKNASGITKVFQRLTGMEAKLAQYEEGEEFIVAVETAGGRELFDQVWASAENVPSLDEIRQPELWIERVGGSTFSFNGATTDATKPEPVAEEAEAAADDVTSDTSGTSDDVEVDG